MRAESMRDTKQSALGVKKENKKRRKKKNVKLSLQKEGEESPAFGGHDRGNPQFRGVMDGHHEGHVSAGMEGLEESERVAARGGGRRGGKGGSSAFLEKMRARLQGGRFRMLNEKLYTCRGEDALQFFSKDPDSFFQYHKGYREQTSHWPRLPVHAVADWLKARAPSLVVADFGCGDATLAANVTNKVFSLDLVAANPSVIACNMAHTPLEGASVDVAVFCLSLMGTDYPAFLSEAYRVLKPKGTLIIAEVKSRFDPANGGGDPQHFVNALKSLGLRLQAEDTSNKMFLMFFFQKDKVQEPLSKKKRAAIDWPILKACIYKRR